MCLISTAWTSLHVASEDVQLIFRDAAILARLSICSPVFSFSAIANALIFFAANPKVVGIVLSLMAGYRPNEKQISHGRVSWQTH